MRVTEFPQQERCEFSSVRIAGVSVWERWFALPTLEADSYHSKEQIPDGGPYTYA